MSLGLNLINLDRGSNRSTLKNTFIPGSGVGGKSRYVQKALQRRASLNPGTLLAPAHGKCIGNCSNHYNN